MHHTVENPVTGRQVKKDSRIGKIIIAHRKNVKCVEKIPKGYVCNPVTRKPVKSSGPTGKLIQRLGEHDKVLYIPTKSKKRKDCLNGYRRAKKMGSGAFGSVYEACKKKNCKYVLKVQEKSHREHSWLRPSKEANKSVKAGKLGIGPKIYDYWKCGGDFYMVMEKLDTTIWDLIHTTSSCQVIKDTWKSIVKVLRKMKKHGMVHGDLHTGNVMVKGKRAYVIDWGRDCAKARNVSYCHDVWTLVQKFIRGSEYKLLKNGKAKKRDQNAYEDIKGFVIRSADRLCPLSSAIEKYLNATPYDSYSSYLSS